MKRRQMLQWTGAGIGLVASAGLLACRRESELLETLKILKEGDKLVMEEDPAEIIQKAYDLGYKYEEKNGGCARCTVAALQDALPFVDTCEPLFRSASCVDGGASSTKLHSCGGFTGSGLVIAWLCGSTREGSKFTGDGKYAKSLMKKVHERYLEEYGSVICKEVREAGGKDCPNVVGNAAMWTSGILLEAFT